MTFRFRLQRVLDLRRMQLGLEESRVQRDIAALAVVDREREAVESAAVSAEAEVRAASTLTGSDLAALSGFRLHAGALKQRLAQRRIDCHQKLAAHQAAAVEARRRYRLLERLKQRRHAEWRSAQDKELEQMASESFLAGWAKESRFTANGDPAIRAGHGYP